MVGSVGDETTRVDQWLTTTLKTDSTLAAFLAQGANGVHADEVPPRGTFPAVVHQFQGGADVRGAGPLRIMISGLWIVKAIAETRNYLDVKAIADRIDVLLQAKSGTADGGYIFACVRESPFRMAEHDQLGNRDFRHLGGAYRCIAQVP